MTQTTSNLSNSVRTLYGAQYLQGAMPERLYDQFAQPVGQLGVEQAARMGATVQVPFASIPPIATAAISQVADITPRTLRDAVASITSTSRGDALQWAELVDIQAYTDIGAERVRAAGGQAARSIDWLAMTAALSGSLVLRAAARASLDAGTSGHRLSDSIISTVETRLAAMGCPYFDFGGGNSWVALMPPEPYHDLRTGGNIVNVGVYQDKEIILNFELGKVGAFKIVRSPFAKVFGAAGADNASNVATTIAAAVTTGHNNALATGIEVAANTNIVAGDELWIGTEETATTYDPLMERVTVAATPSGTTVSIVGAGPNGGLLYDHPVGHAVRNADSVFPVVYGSPYSMAKLYDAATGEFGKMLDPQVTGYLEQFWTLAWKYYGGYGRFRENCILRGEYAWSGDA